MATSRHYRKKCRHCGEWIEYFHGEKEEICPKCGMNDYIKPETETDLFLLQKKYLDTRDKKYLGEIYKILVKYGASKIKKMLNGNVIYSVNKIEECSHDAATMLISYFLQNPDFKIETSFMGFLTKSIEFVLYNKKQRRVEDIDSLNAHIDDADKDKLDLFQFESLFNPIHDEFNEENYYGDNITVELISLLRGITKEIKKNYGGAIALKNLIGILHSVKCKRNEKMISEYYNLYGGYELKSMVDKTLLILHKHIKNRL
jgi:hypothetical protein